MLDEKKNLQTTDKMFGFFLLSNFIFGQDKSVKSLWHVALKEVDGRGCTSGELWVVILSGRLCRIKMWTTIANRYIAQLAFDWDKMKRLLLHDRSNPDEEALGMQILKDLHRTGITDYMGDHNDRERYLLKRVLIGMDQ